jgi:hypothetical protein
MTNSNVRPHNFQTTMSDTERDRLEAIREDLKKDVGEVSRPHVVRMAIAQLAYSRDIKLT